MRRLVLFALVGSASVALPVRANGQTHPAVDGKDCLTCHAPVRSHKTLHAPVKDNQCEICHQVPQRGGPTALTEAPEKLCLVCHEKEKFTSANVHGPVALGACIACHDPHGSNSPHLVRASGKALCLTCHAEMGAQMSAAKFQHGALEIGCTACHNPHASPLKYQLKAEAPALCASCHPKILEQAHSAQVKHAPVEQQRACLNCHDPHVAQYRPQLKADGLNTCLTCHDRKVAANGIELADMKKLLVENPDHHGPIRDRDCSGCHQPHGSSHFRLLKNEYPKDFYAPFQAENFALCFGCHEAALSREERTTRLTDFRNGDRNLHFVHVNKTPKGRTCRACHETHASSFPNHIRKSVPFGRWELPINFAKTPAGGSCAPGCHAPQTYDRTNPIQAKRQ